jgi:hypothetical protein
VRGAYREDGIRKISAGGVPPNVEVVDTGEIDAEAGKALDGTAAQTEAVEALV